MSWEKMLMQFAMQALPGVLTRLGAGRAGEVFRELESDYRVWLETNAPVLRARGANIPDLSDLVAQDRAAVDARMREREEAETPTKSREDGDSAGLLVNVFRREDEAAERASETPSETPARRKRKRE
jgi:hypothetical protein